MSGIEGVYAFCGAVLLAYFIAICIFIVSILLTEDEEHIDAAIIDLLTFGLFDKEQR